MFECLDDHIKIKERYVLDMYLIIYIYIYTHKPKHLLKGNEKQIDIQHFNVLIKVKIFVT